MEALNELKKKKQPSTKVDLDLDLMIETHNKLNHGISVDQNIEINLLAEKVARLRLDTANDETVNLVERIESMSNPMKKLGAVHKLCHPLRWGRGCI